MNITNCYIVLICTFADSRTSVTGNVWGFGLSQCFQNSTAMQGTSNPDGDLLSCCWVPHWDDIRVPTSLQYRLSRPPLGTAYKHCCYCTCSGRLWFNALKRKYFKRTKKNIENIHIFMGCVIMNLTGWWACKFNMNLEAAVLERFMVNL